MTTSVEYRVPYNYLPLQYSDTAHHNLARDILRDIEAEVHRGLFTLGPWVEKFEQAICEKYDVGYCIGVNSGTDALILSLKVLGIGQGDTVLVPSNTFLATVGAVVSVGATPMFIDVGADYQMDIDKAVHRRVEAVINVHLTGLARNIHWFKRTINDAAQAIGAEHEEQSVATFADMSCFSLHPLKNLHCLGDGGFITTDHEDDAEELTLLRNHGLLDRDTCVMPGYNSRLDSIQAIAAWHGLKIIDEVNDKRRANAARYDAGLKDCSGVTIPPRFELYKQVYHTYMLQFEERDELKNHLAKCGVDARIHYPVPVHLQPGYRYLGYRRGDLPETERQADRILSLPIHEYLTEDQVDYAIDCIRGFYKLADDNQRD
jgi:dTDP-3-amino-2,3,6-trideoxy-4-keto-D-glucose/dTDP-3-amino-3,4,6-trideoxy-alpha-D-glucose/dTDP-2,6-dideoxy-D-kanosamine transaminase